MSVGGHARAVVDHLRQHELAPQAGDKAQFTALCNRIDAFQRALGQRLDRIERQIQHHLADQHTLAVHRQRFRRLLDRDRHALRVGGDVGAPVTVTDPTGEAAVAFEALAKKVDAQGPSRVYRPELRIT